MSIRGIEEIEFENTPIEELDSEVVNLIFVGIDGSGSMNRYIHDMKRAIIDFKKALSESNENDELLVSRGDFRNTDISIGGYKKIDDFTVDYTSSGGTPLYDIIIESTERLNEYLDVLKKNGMRTKAVFSIFSDGEDTTSKNQLKDAIKAIEKMNNKEIITAFIAFGNEAIEVGKKLNFSNILTISNEANEASEIRKAFNCLSRSVIENSKSVIQNKDNFFI